jgi:hypothetical protein
MYVRNDFLKAWEKNEHEYGNSARILILIAPAKKSEFQKEARLMVVTAMEGCLYPLSLILQR